MPNAIERRSEDCRLDRKGADPILARTWHKVLLVEAEFAAAYREV